MKRTYKIIDVKVNHPTAGVLLKQNIIYLVEGKELTREFYTGNPNDIREGYEPDDKDQPVKKIDLSMIDIDSLTDEQLQKLKARFASI